MKISESRTSIWFDPPMKRGGSSRSDTPFGMAEPANSPAPTLSAPGASRKFAAALSSIGTNDADDRQAKALASGKAVENQFVQWGKMSPAEKIRDMILQNHGLTDEELDARPSEERAKIENEIEEAVKRRYGVESEAAGAPEA